MVALLRELGASKRLATLIEGESLLNDGVAYVFFLIWKEELSGEKSRSVADMVTFFCQLSFGGVLPFLCPPSTLHSRHRHLFF